MLKKKKRKTGTAMARGSRPKVDFAVCQICANDNASGSKWQHLRIAKRFGVSISHAKLICTLAGIGGAAND